MAIKLDEDRKFYQQYRCEVLTAVQENQALIKGFKSGDIGIPLERYLKESAWKEDSEGETRVYLIKDTNSKIALYFSLKCGLLYEPHDYFRLDSDEQDFVNMFIDAIRDDDLETIRNYYESGYYSSEKMDRLFKIAKDRLEIKDEGAKLGDEDSTLKVHKCYSAIELRHFCKNVDYCEDKRGIPLGVGLFWEVIVPQICKITDMVGCEYLYLFAADNTEMEEEPDKTRRLLQYYRNELKFEDIQGLMIIKPDYDRSCWALIQKISDLKRNRETIWEEFSDVYE